MLRVLLIHLSKSKSKTQADKQRSEGKYDMNSISVCIIHLLFPLNSLKVPQVPPQKMINVIPFSSFVCSVDFADSYDSEVELFENVIDV